MEQEPFKIELKSAPLGKGFFVLLLFFVFSLIFGIFVTFRLNQFFKIEKQQIVPISLWQFLIESVLGVFLILFIIFFGRRVKKAKKIILKLLFLIATSFGALISLGVIFGDISFLLVLILIILWLKKPNVFFHNVLVILGIAGTGSYLGLSFTPQIVVLILILFSIYDYIAVYKTKHMVVMAKEMVQEGAIMGLIVPQKLLDFRALLDQVRPGEGKFFILGGGDITFPLLLCSSILPRGLASSLIIAGFATIGLCFSVLLFARQKSLRPIPALPPISFFLILGYLITLLI